jgi:hypothetical protein
MHPVILYVQLSEALMIILIVIEAVSRTSRVYWVVVHTAGIVRILVDGASAFILRYELFHFPIVLLGANREFEVFLCN